MFHHEKGFPAFRRSFKKSPAGRSRNPGRRGNLLPVRVIVMENLRRMKAAAAD
jgi:hypothetical protein